MKKCLLVLALVLLTLFGGCAQQAKTPGSGETPAAPQAYTADLQINYKGDVSQAKYVQRSLGDCDIEFTAPSTIKGLKISYVGTKCTFSLAGLSFDADLSAFPQTNFGKSMIEAFKSAVEDTTIEKTRSGSCWRYEGETSGEKFLIVQDAVTGCFESFEIPGYSLKIELKNIIVT